MTSIDQLMAAADAAHDAGRLTDAEQAFVQVLSMRPQYAPALHGLGLVIGQLGRKEEAVRLMRQSIAADASNSVYHNNLANLLLELGQAAEAIPAYTTAVTLRPDFWQAWHNLSSAQLQEGQTDAAIESCQKALSLNPRFAGAHSQMGRLLALKERWDEAELSLHAAIQLDSRLARAYANLGDVILKRLSAGEHGRKLGSGVHAKDPLVCRRLDEAEAAYRRAIELGGNYPELYANLGSLFLERGNLDEAIRCNRKAIEVNPRRPESWCALAMALNRSLQLEETEACYRKAIELRPDYPEAHNNLAGALSDQWRVGEAIEHLRRALAIRPDFIPARTSLLLYLHYDPKYDQQTIFTEHVEWGRQLMTAAAGQVRPHKNDREPRRRLRIGYLSPDFRVHSVGFFLEPILTNHDHGRFEVFCYSDVAAPDAVTERMCQAADHWRDVAGQPDQQLAELIRSDGIDILIDLAGHTAGTRLRALAYKPAPVQMAYLGYPDTTGLPSIDYRITDAVTDPPGTTEAFHTEQLLRLDGCFLCYRPHDDAPEVAPLPARQAGCITFGCFNSIAKLTVPMLGTWARILRGVPGSRLLLKCGGLASPDTRRRIIATLAQAGVAPERIELLKPEVTHAKHLATYGRVDIALDAFPYCGTTTTCEAMWMGVPVVSLAGRAHVSRVGCSLLSTVGLAELVAGDEEQYVRIAADLAANLNRLASLRSGLRDRMQASGLLDGAGFTHRVEVAYRSAWEKWCNTAAPAS